MISLRLSPGRTAGSKTRYAPPPILTSRSVIQTSKPRQTVVLRALTVSGFATSTGETPTYRTFFLSTASHNRPTPGTSQHWPSVTQFHVTAIDLRGHGESDRSPDGTYSFDALYSDLDAFMSAAGLEHPVICGLSLGGTLSYTYASRRPHGVRALVIAESAPEPPRESPNAGRDSIRSFTSGSGEFSSLEELVEKVRTFTPWRSASQVRSGLTHSVGQNIDGNWTWKYDPAIRNMLGPSTTATDRWHALSLITAPTLLVRGENSNHTDAETFARMTEIVPNSQIVSIQRAGHRVSGDNPHDFNLALREFLLRHAL